MLFFIGMVIFVLGLLLYLSPFKVIRTEAFGVDIDTLTRAFEIALMGFGILVMVLGLFGFFEERLKQVDKRIETQTTPPPP